MKKRLITRSHFFAKLHFFLQNRETMIYSLLIIVYSKTITIKKNFYLVANKNMYKQITCTYNNNRIFAQTTILIL